MPFSIWQKYTHTRIHTEKSLLYSVDPIGLVPMPNINTIREIERYAQHREDRNNKCNKKHFRSFRFAADKTMTCEWFCSHIEICMDETKKRATVKQKRSRDTSARESAANLSRQP